MIGLNSTNTHGDDAVALSALVAYLRPSPRARLLPILAELGIFVLERARSLSPAETASDSLNADLVVFVGGGEAAHLVLAQGLALRVSPALVALVPDDATARLYLDAGAYACASDSDSIAELTDAIRVTAEAARRLRDQAPIRIAEPMPVFGNLGFSLAPPELSHGDRSLRLSVTERNILLALIGSRGSPVSWAALGVHLGGDVPASAGYVKTVILRIRRKVQLLGGDPEVIGAVRGFGYVLRG